MGRMNLFKKIQILSTPFAPAESMVLSRSAQVVPATLANATSQLKNRITKGRLPAWESHPPGSQSI